MCGVVVVSMIQLQSSGFEMKSRAGARLLSYVLSCIYKIIIATFIALVM